jgi:uroporphyrinogen-III decarboxylase
LPFAKPDEVEDQVLQLCEIFSKNGGFVFTTVHNIQANVPINNIIAMFNAIKKFNGQAPIIA